MDDNRGGGVGRLASDTQNSPNPRQPKVGRRQIVQFVTPRIRMRNKGGPGFDDEDGDVFADESRDPHAQSSSGQIPTGGGLASLEIC